MGSVNNGSYIVK